MAVDCVLFVDGVRFADTGNDLAAGVPTALADLEVVWGRDTTVDQPDAATCTTTVVDKAGGTTLLDTLDVGTSIDVVASGNIATGLDDNIVTDPSFETLPPGPVTARVSVSAGTAVVVTAPVHTGARAIGYDPTVAATMLIPPAAFDLADPTAWDDLPPFDPATVWAWSLAVHVDHHQAVTVTPVRVAGPAAVTPGAAVGDPVTVTGPAGWHIATGETTPAGGAAGGWVGLRVDVAARPAWTVVASTWQDTPDTWLDYRGAVVDDVALIAPASALVRAVLVFSGVITDLSVTADRAGTLTATVTAADQLVDLENRAVGDVPWPAETLTARVDHIVAAAGTSVDARIDPGLADAVVSWRDVDNQPAGSLLAGYAQGVDGVLWSATHATTGPFVWFEDPTGRAQLGQLEQHGALVVIVPATAGRGSTHLDGCLIPAEPLEWVRDVSDVITRVDATWSEQTLNDDGNPAPTERVVTVIADPATIERHGIRRLAINTNLTTEAAAVEIAQRVLFRATTVEWRATGLTLDLNLTPPPAGDATADVLDLLDGTARLGRGLILTDATVWPAADTVGLYLEGGTYRYDGDWELALNVSSNTGLGTSALWNEMDPTWAWNEMDPTIRWFDLYGVAA